MKSKDRYILSIDAGTQSIRSAIVNQRGEVLFIKKRKIKAYYSNSPGLAEQDANYLWDEMLLSTSTLLESINFSVDEIEGVSLTSQRASFVVMGQDDEPSRPAIIWLDRRQAKLNSWSSIFDKVKLWIVNMLDAANYAVKEAEINWIAQNEKDIYNSAKKFLLLSGFFNFKLSGEYKDSISNQVGYIPFDYKNHTWIKSRFNVKKKMFPIPEDKLPELVPTGNILGRISKDTARLSGLPEGLPIYAGSADKSAEVLGSGVLSEDIACLSYGTTATVQCTTKRYFELQRFFPPYPGAVPGYYNTEAMVYRGFWMIDWFKNEFGLEEVKKAAKLGVEAESLMDKLIKDIEPGANGLILQPYWSAGVKNPGLEAKGAIVGFGDIHTRAHIYRAIVEGLAFALKHGLEKTISKTGFNIKKIRVSGGGSQSDEIMQITADIMGMPVERPHTYETSILGAAINAAVGLGWYKNYETAVSNMTRINDVFYPNEKNKKLYKQIYREVYVNMYPKLRPLYKRIRSIFNYPEI